MVCISPSACRDSAAAGRYSACRPTPTRTGDALPPALRQIQFIRANHVYEHVPFLLLKDRDAVSFADPDGVSYTSGQAPQPRGTGS
jgi:hypothetical protein